MLLATSIMTGSDQLLLVSHVFVIDTALDSSYLGPDTESLNGGGSAAKPPLRSAAPHGWGLGVCFGLPEAWRHLVLEVCPSLSH